MRNSANNPSEKLLCLLISNLTRKMRLRFDQKASQLGLTQAQWRTLNAVMYNERVSQRRLAEILEIESATVGRLLDSLEAAQWIERKKSESDRRVQLIYLSEKVDPLVDAIRVIGRETEDEVFEGFSKKEKEQLRNLLQRAEENLMQVTQTATATKEYVEA